VSVCDAPTPWSTKSDEQPHNDTNSASGLRFEVTDTGSGLEGVDPAMLFEPFEQGSVDCYAKDSHCADETGVISCRETA
jgi:hypothetical protein